MVNKGLTPPRAQKKAQEDGAGPGPSKLLVSVRQSDATGTPVCLVAIRCRMITVGASERPPRAASITHYRPIAPDVERASDG